MIFTPLKETERNRLSKALCGNADNGLALLTGKDTSFIGTAENIEDIQRREDNEVIFAIKSVPCHY